MRRQLTHHLYTPLGCSDVQYLSTNWRRDRHDAATAQPTTTAALSVCADIRGRRAAFYAVFMSVGHLARRPSPITSEMRPRDGYQSQAGRSAPLQIASCVDQYASWKQRATTGSQLKDYLIAWRRHFAAIGHLVRDAAICRCRVVCQMTDTRTQMRRRPTVFFWTRVPAMLSACPPKTAPQCGVFNPFSTSCSKLLLFEGFSAILV